MKNIEKQRCLREVEMMRNERIELWTKEEYQYPAAYGFRPVMFSCIHEDTKKHPAILIVPGGSYREVSPSEAHLPAMEFYQTGYNVFVLAYTINLLDEAPLKLQPLNDISRAVRMIRFHAKELHSRADQIAICGFSAGGHLCASLCVHGKDVTDPDENYQSVSNRPDAVVLAYPVISSGKYGHRDSFVALLGKNPTEQELDYMALENHVTGDTPPCFLWQTATDEVVPVQNSYLFAQACAKAGVPFAHHVFSEGVHGLSVATEEWFLQKTGQTARKTDTLEQVKLLAEAIKDGRTPFPKEKGEEILVAFGIGRQRPERWSEEEKETIHRSLKEVRSWTRLAEEWLEKYLLIK